MKLTKAELELSKYLHLGDTCNELAKRLKKSGHTIRAQLKSIYKKLDINTRQEATIKLLKLGVIKP